MSTGAWAEPRPEAVALAVAVAHFDYLARELARARRDLRAAMAADAATKPTRNPTPVCGTPGGYSAHRRRREPINPACVEAHTWAREQKGAHPQ